MHRKRRWPRWLAIILVVLVLLGAASVATRQYYFANLGPAGASDELQEFVVEEGATPPEVAHALAERQLIRNARVFGWYLKLKSSSSDNVIFAGTYRLQQSMTTPQIVEIITKGAVTSDLVTIYPGMRLDEVRTGLITAGFDPASVDRALNPALYTGHPALVGKPIEASLEGYLYPESFQLTKQTSPETIIRQSLDEMNKQFTAEIRAAFAARNLNPYQGLTLASIIEQEAHDTETRRQVAQVFLSRLAQGMKLQSDPTAVYGALLAGVPENEVSLRHDSPYNTYLYAGLSPTPISNVSADSLRALANPATTDWLYFVAGDDGKTHFSRTLAEHEALTKRYCSEQCGN